MFLAAYFESYFVTKMSITHILHVWLYAFALLVYFTCTYIFSKIFKSKVYIDKLYTKKQDI